MKTLLAALLLVGCSDAVLCGWSHVGTRQLAEAPGGRCWLLVTPSDMATTPAEAHAEACDVKPGDRVYPGGALVDFWGNSSLSGGERDFHAEGVDCP